MSSYVCDTETTVEEVPHVWSWESLEIGDVDKPIRGTSIESLIEWLLHESKTVYFHNLKFDASYILSWLFKNGYEHTEKRFPKEKEFTTLISDTGVYYQIVINGGNGLCKLLDSFKVISMSVADIAKAYGLSYQKLEIDYKKERALGYEPTDEEWAYQHADVAIMSLAMNIQFEHGMKKMTQSGNALAFYKNMVGEKMYKRCFPELSELMDSFCRIAYLGGSSQVAKRFKGLELGCGLILDVNSMYPWAMKYCRLPYGEGVLEFGKPDFSNKECVYICRLSCKFRLKEKHIPSVMGKHIARFSYAKFLESSDGEIVTLTLTSVDVLLLFEQYDVDCVTWDRYYKFKTSTNLFSEYIDYWYKEKEAATLEKNGAKRSIAKDMMNKLSGKFGVRTKLSQKIPFYEGRIKYKLKDGYDVPYNKGYVPVIAFITAYGRAKVIRAAQANYERFVYMDTDSLHLLGWELPTNIEIDDVKLGAFALEGRFTRIKALHPKCYLEEIVEDNGGTHLKVTVAGLPKQCHEQVNFENFRAGARYTGKLLPKMTESGILLTDTVFTIKDE